MGILSCVNPVINVIFLISKSPSKTIFNRLTSVQCTVESWKFVQTDLCWLQVFICLWGHNFMDLLTWILNKDPVSDFRMFRIWHLQDNQQKFLATMNSNDSRIIRFLNLSWKYSNPYLEKKGILCKNDCSLSTNYEVVDKDLFIIIRLTIILL